MAQDAFSALQTRFDFTQPEAEAPVEPTSQYGYYSGGFGKPEVDAEVGRVAKARKVELEQTAKYKPIDVYDTAGQLVGSGAQGDGDSQPDADKSDFTQNRLAHDKEGYSYDAWETDHGEEWYNNLSPERQAAYQKKMAKQRLALSEITGKAYNDVTNADVYKVGDYAAQELYNFRAAGQENADRISVTRDKLAGQALDGKRGLYDEFNTQGKSALAHMNTPLLNAAFYSDFNRKGQADQELGSTIKNKGAWYSERDMKNSPSAVVIGGLVDGLNVAGDKLRDLTADVASSAVRGTLTVDTMGVLRQLTKKATAPEEKAIIDSVIEKRKESERLAVLAQNLEGMGRPSPYSTTPEENFRQLMNSDESEYLRTGFYMGTNEQGEKQVMEGSLKNLAVEEAATAVEDAFGKGEETTAVSDNTESQQAIEETKGIFKEAGELYDKGETTAAVGKYLSGITQRITDHPTTVLQDVAKSLPEMVVAMASFPLAATLTANKSMNDQIEGYKENHDGVEPTGADRAIIAGLAAVKGAADAGVDKFLLKGSGGLTDTGYALAEKLGQVTKLGTNKAAGLLTVAGATLGGTAVEGASEAGTDLLEQIGKNLSSDKEVNWEDLYVSAVGGATAGGATKGAVTTATQTGIVLDNARNSGNKQTVSPLQAVDSTLTNEATIASDADLKAAEKQTVAPTDVATDNKGITGAIAKVESGKAGYNAYNRGKAGDSSKPINLTNMTIGELMMHQAKAIKDPTRIFAAGLMQITPNTMKDAMAYLKMDKNTKFNAATQQYIYSEYLIKQRRKPAYNYITGKSNNANAAQLSMAQEWASIAQNSGGKSYYAGTGNNAAHLSDKDIDALLLSTRNNYKSLVSKGIAPDRAYKLSLQMGSTSGASSTPGSFVEASNVAQAATTANTPDIPTQPIPEATTSEVVPEAAPIAEAPTTLAVDDAFAELDKLSADSSAADAVNAKADSAFDAKLDDAAASNIEALDKLLRADIVQEQVDANPTDTDLVTQLDGQRLEAEAAIKAVDTAPLVAQIEAAPSSQGAVQALAGLSSLRGSAALKQVDTTKLDSNIVQMVTDLADFDSDIKTTADLAPKTMSQVTGEVLGTQTVQGKRGLGQHMSNIQASVAVGSEALARSHISKLTKFSETHQTKLREMNSAIDEAANTGESVGIELENGFKFTAYADKLPAAEAMAKQVQTEVDLIESGVMLSTELADAAFLNKEATPTESAIEPSQPVPAPTTPDAPDNAPTDVTEPVVDTPDLQGDTGFLDDAPELGEQSTPEVQPSIEDTAPTIGSSEQTTAPITGEEFVAKHADSTKPLVKQVVARIKKGDTPKPEQLSLLDQRATASKPAVRKTAETPTSTAITAIAQGDISSLSKVKGLGKAKLQAIKEHVAKNGLKDVAELSAVKGVGKVMLQKITDALASTPTNTPVTKTVTEAVQEAVDTPPTTEPTVEDKVLSESVREAATQRVTSAFLFDADKAEYSAEAGGTVLNDGSNEVVKAKGEIEVATLSHGSKVSFIEVAPDKHELTAVEKKVLPLRKAYKQAKKVSTTINTKLADAFGDDFKTMMQGLTPEEQAIAKKLQAFHSTFVDSLKERVLHLDGHVKGSAITAGATRIVGGQRSVTSGKMFKYSAVENPISLLMDHNNNLPTQVLTAMSVEVLEWIKADGLGTGFNSRKDIAQILNKDEDQVTTSEMQTLALVGTSAVLAGSNIGKGILKQLNIKQDPDADTDPLNQARLEQALGDVALTALQRMQNPKTGKKLPFLQTMHVPAEIFLKKGETLEEEGAQSVQVKMPVPLGKNGLPKYKDNKREDYKATASLSEILHDDAYKSFMASTFKQGDEAVTYNYVFGDITAVPKEYKGTFADVPKEMQDAALKSQKDKLEPNSIYSLYSAMSDTAVLKIGGWVAPDVIENGSKGLAVGRLGKNQSLEKGLQHVREFEGNRAAKQQHLEEELMILRDESLQSTLRDQAIGSDNDNQMDLRDSINKEITKAEAQLKYVNAGQFSLPSNVWKTGRAGDKSNAISIQRDKIARNAFSYVDHVKVLDGADPKTVEKLKLGFLEPTPLKSIDDFDTVIMNTATGDIMNETVDAGVQAILDQLEGKEFNEDAIVDAVDELGEAGHSMNALMNLAKWHDALASREDTSSPALFLSDMYIEVDGTNNGVIAALRQLGADFEGPDEGLADAYEDILHAGGQMFTKDGYVNAEQFIQEGNLDVYQGTALDAAERIEEALLDTRPDAEINTALQKIYKALEEEKEPFAKRVLGEQLTELLQVRAARMFKELNPPFVIDGAVTPAGRNAAKPFVMTGAYSAGDASMLKSGFHGPFGILKGVYKELEKVGVEQLNTLNSALTRMGVENDDLLQHPLDELSKPALAALEKYYSEGLGSAVLFSYRTRMGGFQENTKAINTIMNIISTIDAISAEDAISKMEAKDGLPLDKAKRKEFLKGRMAKGIYSGMQNAASTGHNDALSIVSENKQLVPAEQGGKTYVPMRENASEVQVFELDNGELVSKGIKAYSSRTSSLKKTVLDPNIRVKGMLTGNISIDAVTQARVKNQVDTGLGDVFDAILWGIDEAVDNTKLTNKVWDDIHRTWSMWESVSERADMMHEYFKSLPADMQQKITNTLIQNKVLDKVVDKEEFKKKSKKKSKPKYKSISDVITEFQQTAAIGKYHQDRVNEAIEGSGQYLVKGGDHFVKEPSTRGSSAEQINIEEFAKDKSSTATPSVVKELFMKIGNLEGTTSTTQHSEHLQEVLSSVVDPLLTPESGFSVNHLHGVNETGGAYDGDTKSVYVKTNKGKVTFGTDMTGQETLVHEFVHPVWEKGLKYSQGVTRKLTRLYNIAKANVAPSDLLLPHELNNPEALERAEAMWEHMFGEGRNYLHEFATFGITNQRVMNALNNIGKVPISTGTNTGKQDGIVGWLKNLLGQLVLKVRKHTRKATIDNQLLNMARDIQAVKQQRMVELADKMLNAKLTTKATSLLTEKVLEPLHTWANTPTTSKMSAEDAAVFNAQRSTFSRVADVAKIPILALDGVVAKVFGETYQAMVDGNTNVATKFLTEARGATEITRPFHKLLAQFNQEVEATSQAVSGTMKSKLSELIKGGVLKDAHDKAFHSVWLSLDPASLDMSLDEIKEVADSDKVLDDKITSIVNSLASFDKNWINQQAASLGHFIAKGETQVSDTNMNAHNIINGVGHATGRGLNKVDYAKVNQLKSLYGLKFASNENKDALSELISTQSPLLAHSAHVMTTLRNHKLLNEYEGDMSREVPDDVPHGTNTSDTVKVVKAADAKNMLADGYVKLASLPNGNAVYSRTSSTAAEYQNGLASIASFRLEGMFIPLAKATDGDKRHAVPVVIGQRIIGYRATIPLSIRAAQLGGTGKGVQALANMAGKEVKVVKGNFFNDKLLKLAQRDFKKNFKEHSKEFIKVSTSSPNAQVREFAKIAPPAMREAIQNSPNGSFYIRKNSIDLILGYHKFSAADGIARMLGGNVQVTKALQFAEKQYQRLVAEAKRRIVILTPAVPIGNMLSNLMVSSLMGMNPVKTLKDQEEGLEQLVAYTRIAKQSAALQHDITYSGDPKGAQAQRDKKRLLTLKGRMENMAMHDLVSEGLYSTIIEDVDINNGDGGLVIEAVNKVAPDFLTSKPGRFIRTGVAYATLTPNTALGEAIQNVTGYGDVIAKYAALKHLRAKGVPKAEAISEVMDTFIDYAPNTSKTIQYLNDMGLFMFTKFLIRIQRVIAKHMAKNMEGVLALEAAQALINHDVPDVMDAFVGFGVGIGGRSLTPLELADKSSGIPILELGDSPLL